MQAFEYLVGLVSILVGLALADLALSLHKLLRARARVQWHWHAPAAAVILVLLVLDFWWGMRQLERTGVTMTIGLFLPMVVALFVFFLLAAAAFPDEVPADGLDLRAYYLENSRYFWTLFALFVLLVSLHIATITIQRFDARPDMLVRLAAALMPNAVAIALAATLALVRRPWWHSAGLLFLLVALFASYLTRPLT